MKFITVMSAEKALKFIDNLELENNLVFDFPEDVLENLKLKLEDLTGMLTTPVVGVAVSYTHLDVYKRQHMELLQ